MTLLGERSPGPPRVAAGAADAVRDAVHLARWRLATVRRPRAVLLAVLVVTGATLTALLLPALLDGAGSGAGRAALAAAALPGGLTAFVVLAAASAVAMGGGRELLPRDQAVAFPVSSTTDHLGALLLAPLNIAWLGQGWALLAATAYVVGPHPGRLAAAQALLLAWVLAATALGQVAGWSVEWVRRGRHGVAVVRSGAVLAGGAAGALVLSGRGGWLVDLLPSRVVADLLPAAPERPGGWLAAMTVLLLVAAAATVLGALPAAALARRPPREEGRSEGRARRPRPSPGSDLAALVRVDRASVWRAVPVRRGAVVLTVGPGVVALVSAPDWPSLVVVPALVASGCALLFGVNAWALDGGGALWRESLPVDPRTAYLARSWVLGEALLLPAAGALALGCLRSGVPTPTELLALGCGWLVVTATVVSASMRWSAARPYVATLRSARSTPAPPLAMVGYSTRLALVTALLAVLYSSLARVPVWELPVLLSVPVLAWSGFRWTRALRRWADPRVRSGVAAAVAA